MLKEHSLFLRCCLWSCFGLMILVPAWGKQLQHQSAGSSRLTATTSKAQVSAAVEAWGGLFQAVKNIEASITTKRLGLVHSEELELRAALTILLEDSKLTSGGKRSELEVALSTFGRLVANLDAATHASDQASAEAQLRMVLRAFENLKTFYSNEIITQAGSLSEGLTCPMHPDVTGKKEGSCAKCGMRLDQPVRLSLLRSGRAKVIPLHTISASIRVDSPLEVGVPANAYLRLAKIDGSPALLSDLREVHTEKIHLLIIDSSLTDYHHVHPRPTEVPGEYAFSFRPRRPGRYRAWADVRPDFTGFQEYAMAVIRSSATGEPLTDKSVKLSAKLEDLRYDITLNQSEIKVGQPVQVRLRITNSDGTPFTRLEPVMGTFAHLVGFSEDYETVLHMHPAGLKPPDLKDRGGPELEFNLFATRPGFVRLFAQVQINGAAKFIPFGLNIAP